MAGADLPALERLVGTEDHHAGGGQAQVEQVEQRRIGIRGGQPLTADRHGRLMPEHHQHPMLALGLRDLVEHGLHAVVIQALAVIHRGMVAEGLEHALAGLQSAGRARTGDAIRDEFELGQSLGHGLGLFEALVGQVPVTVAGLAQGFGLGVAHHDEDMPVFLGRLGHFLEIDSHCPVLPWPAGRRPSPLTILADCTTRPASGRGFCTNYVAGAAWPRNRATT